MKAFASDNLNVTQVRNFVCNGLEKKWEKEKMLVTFLWLPLLSSIPKMFTKAFFPKVIKGCNNYGKLSIGSVDIKEIYLNGIETLIHHGEIGFNRVYFRQFCTICHMKFKQERQIVARYARLTPSCKAGACSGQNSSMKNNKGH